MLLRCHRSKKITLWSSTLSFLCGFLTHWDAFTRDVSPRN